MRQQCLKMQFHGSYVSPREGPAETPVASLLEIIPQRRQGQNPNYRLGVSLLQPGPLRRLDSRVDGAHHERGSHRRSSVIQHFAGRVHPQRLASQTAHQSIQYPPESV